MSISFVTAQTYTISGVVTSGEDSQPVIGASVLVKGTYLGAVTLTANLLFQMYQVPQKYYTLLIKYRYSPL